MAGVSATYVSSTQFTVATDRTSEFSVGRRIKADCGVNGFKYGTIESVAYLTATTVTLTAASDDLTSNLTQVWYGITKRGASGSLVNHTHADEDTGGLIGDLILSGGNIGISADLDLLQLSSNQLDVDGQIRILNANPLKFSSRGSKVSWGTELYLTSNANNDLIIGSDTTLGGVGIGTALPGSSLHILVTGETAELTVERSGFASTQVLAGSGSGNIGTTNDFPFKIRTNNTDKLTILSNGNIGFWTSTFGTDAVKVLALFAGTAPTSSPADIVQLWVEDVGGAGQAELRVRDELGNVTTLSPHNFELFEPDPTYEYPWSYRAESPYIGKKINVDMYGAIEAIEQLTGKQFIFTEDIPKANPSDEKKEHWKKLWIEENTNEVEVDKADAFETIDIEEDDKKKVISEKVTYKLEETKIIKVKTPVYKKKVVQKTRLKKDIRFDEDTGKFFKKSAPTDSEAEATAVMNFRLEMPDWVKNRMI